MSRNYGIAAINKLSRELGAGLNISRLLPNNDIVRLTSANKMFRMFGGDTTIRDRAIGRQKYTNRQNELTNDPRERARFEDYWGEAYVQEDDVGNRQYSNPSADFTGTMINTDAPIPAVIPPWTSYRPTANRSWINDSVTYKRALMPPDERIPDDI